MSFYRITLPKALFLSTLIIVVVLVYTIKSLWMFYEYKNKVNTKIELNSTTLQFFLQNEFNKEKANFNTISPIDDKKSPLKTFRFTIDQKDLNTLNSNLPESGKDHYIQAYMYVSDRPEKIRKIKLRYRGDNNFHWLYPQKSLRIKLSSNDIYNMEKEFNLINPPYDYTFIDVLNYKFASSLGLITPDFFPVRIFINGKFMGVYMYLSQVNESLLRKHKIMPGSIYFGDTAPADENCVSSLWFDSFYWVKKAARNAEQKNNREDINYFIDSISNLEKEEFYTFVNTYLDKKKYYAYFALDVILGSEHHDYQHNHKLYFDPYKGLFEPIEWDIRFWHPYGTKDVSVYPLIERISLNPFLENERDKFAYDLMHTDMFKLSTIKKDLQNIMDKQLLDLRADKFKDSARYDYKLLNGWVSEPYSMEDLNRTVNDKLWHYKTRQEKLIKIYNNAKIKYKLTPLNKEFYLLEVTSNGNSAVDMRIKKDINLSIYRDLNFNLKFDKNEILSSQYEILYPGRKIKKGTIEHFTKKLSGNTHVVPAAEYYSFIIKTTHKNLKISDFLFINNITSHSVKPVAVQTIIKNHNDSIHPWHLPQPAYKSILLNGTVNVNKTLIYDQYTTVKIDANTTFVMDENVSIYFYGKVEALGTKEKPIKFMANDPAKPWGLVAVQGKATTGSRFEYVEFENGSVDTRNLIHYTSPFNIHNTDWFEVRHCKVGKNFIGDDSMHIAYAKGIVDSCEFVNARSDGLDIDISDVNITNNIFKNSGNDGLDIMTTTMNASNNTFTDMGDKGISVGEWSEATISDAIFTRTLIGLEIKDKSKVIAENLTFIDSKEKAINLYNKNKRYDTGGFLEATNITFIGNDKVTADKRSKYEIK